MKKILKYLLIMLCALPLFVKSDVAPPLLVKREVKVINKNGTDIVNGQNEKIGSLKYGEIVGIESEVLINNQLYGVIGYFTGKYVKLADTTLISKKVNLEDYKTEYKYRYYVFDDTNVLYNGPSNTYGKVKPETKLKVGTIVESVYHDSMWMYVEQDGVSGWVYIYRDNMSTDAYSINDPHGLAEIPSEDEYYTTKENIKLYDSPKNGKEIGVAVPKNTKLKVIYEYQVRRNTSYYVEYNGTKGWTSTLNFEPKSPTNYEENMMDDHSVENPYKMILICVSGAIALMLVSSLLIKSSNKKNK